MIPEIQYILQFNKDFSQERKIQSVYSILLIKITFSTAKMLYLILSTTFLITILRSIPESRMWSHEHAGKFPISKSNLKNKLRYRSIKVQQFTPKHWLNAESILTFTLICFKWVSAHDQAWGGLDHAPKCCDREQSVRSGLTSVWLYKQARASIVWSFSSKLVTNRYYWGFLYVN